MLGDIPLPIVELGQRRFMSIYPYVDFDDPMFLFNPARDLFEYNDYPASLPELRHGVIPRSDANLINTFFEKLQEYFAGPTAYAKPKVWIEDFTFMKKAYAEEELDKYVNMMLFSESDAYRRMHGVYGKIMKKEFEQDLLEEIEETTEQITVWKDQLQDHEAFVGDPEVQAASNELIQKGEQVLQEYFNPDEVEANIVNNTDKPIPTMLLEKVLDDEVDQQQVLFGDYFLEELQDNLTA